MKDRELFGGDEGWCAEDWVASDDRVRGGKSESHISCDEDIARFYGILDIKTLGGAGFASQRTKSDDLNLDLSDFAGIQLCIAKGDKKRYTFNIKDTLLPPDEESGREQSTISWECDFVLPPEGEPDDAYDKSVFIPWEAFTPTYRGKPKKDTDPLDLKSIKRMSIMIRSFFGSQEGDFSLSIQSISALYEAPPPITYPTSVFKNIDIRNIESGAPAPENEGNFIHLRRILARLSTDRRTAAYTFIGLTAILVICYRLDRRL